MAKKDKRSRRALAAAADLFKSNPNASTDEFRQVCERADKPAIRKLDNRVFNARYVLPFKRSAAARRGTSKPTVRRGTSKPAGGARPARARGHAVKAAPRRRRHLDGHGEIVRLIRERDRQVMAAANDPHKAYEVAAGVQEFAERCVALSRS